MMMAKRGVDLAIKKRYNNLQQYNKQSTEALVRSGELVCVHSKEAKLLDNLTE